MAQKDQRNSAVLLHSAAYVPGDELFKEFPKQTTFGDLDPVIEGADSKPSLAEFYPIQTDDSYIYEKNLTLTKEIASKLNKLIMKGPGVSVPRGVNLFRKPGKNLDLVVPDLARGQVYSPF